MLENNEVQVMEEVADVATNAGLGTNRKAVIIVGAAVLTAGVTYGIYRLAKYLKAKKAAKSAQTESEEVEETHEKSK